MEEKKIYKIYEGQIFATYLTFFFRHNILIYDSYCQNPGTEGLFKI